MYAWERPLRIVVTNTEGQKLMHLLHGHIGIYVFTCNQAEMGPAEQNGGRKLSMLSGVGTAPRDR